MTDPYEGAIAHRDLDDGRVIVMYDMIYNYRLCVGPQNEMFYDRGYCYPKEDGDLAAIALATWDGHGDPPVGWIKETGTERRRERHTRA